MEAVVNPKTELASVARLRSTLPTTSGAGSVLKANGAEEIWHLHPVPRAWLGEELPGVGGVIPELAAQPLLGPDGKT